MIKAQLSMELKQFSQRRNQILDHRPGEAPKTKQLHHKRRRNKRLMIRKLLTKTLQKKLSPMNLRNRDKVWET